MSSPLPLLRYASAYPLHVHLNKSSLQVYFKRFHIITQLAKKKGAHCTNGTSLDTSPCLTPVLSPALGNNASNFLLWFYRQFWISYFKFLPCRNSQRFASVWDSNESKTAAPMSKYVNVQTTNDSVRTFCRFIMQWTTNSKTVSLSDL